MQLTKKDTPSFCNVNHQSVTYKETKVFRTRWLRKKMEGEETIRSLPIKRLCTYNVYSSFKNILEILKNSCWSTTGYCEFWNSYYRFKTTLILFLSSFTKKKKRSKKFAEQWLYDVLFHHFVVTYHSSNLDSQFTLTNSSFSFYYNTFLPGKKRRPGRLGPLYRPGSVIYNNSESTPLWWGYQI